MIKKITSILLILFITFAMISCDKKENSKQGKTIPENFLEKVNNDEYLTENDKEKAIEIIKEYIEKEKKFIGDDGMFKEETINESFELFMNYSNKLDEIIDIHKGKQDAKPRVLPEDIHFKYDMKKCDDGEVRGRLVFKNDTEYDLVVIATLEVNDNGVIKEIQYPDSEYVKSGEKSREMLALGSKDAKVVKIQYAIAKLYPNISCHVDYDYRTDKLILSKWE